MKAIDTNHHEKEKIAALATIEGDLVIEFSKKDWKFINGINYMYNLRGHNLGVVRITDTTIEVGLKK